MPKKKQGFASLSKERRIEIARSGAKAAHGKGVSHQLTFEDRSRGGKKSKANFKNIKRRKLISISRKGGLMGNQAKNQYRLHGCLNDRECLAEISRTKRYWRDKVVKVIQFEDKGQDFLRWYLSKENRVVLCLPFQGNIWQDCLIVKAKLGEKPTFVSNLTGEKTVLLYKIVKISRLNKNA